MSPHAIFTRKLSTALLIILTLTLIFRYHSSPRFPSTFLTRIPIIETSLIKPPKILKMTTLYARSPTIYHTALQCHVLHNTLFNHSIKFQMTPITRGAANTIFWLSSILTAELQKKIEDRADWILYFPPSSILLNTTCPLHALLPPASFREDFKFLILILPSTSSYEDTRAVSVSTFFLRVSTDSLRFLSLVAAEVLSGSEERGEGQDVLTRAFVAVLQREEWKGKVVRQPGRWYGVGNNDQKQGGEERKGLFWQGEQDEAHVRHLLEMERVLDGLESGQSQRQSGPSAEDVEMFWGAVVELRERERQDKT